MGKKITMFGYLAAALAAGISALAAFMMFIEYDYYYGLNNLGYIVMALAMLVVVPVIFHIDISDELWTLFLIFNAGVKFASFGLSVAAANQEA